MTQDLFDPYAPVPETPVKSGNAPEFSVSDLSNALKRTVEDAFSFVRVRGEISGFKRASSGHMYLALKDDKAVIDGVCWRGQAAKLGLVPEDGMEVIVTGRLTTFPGRSKYHARAARNRPAQCVFTSAAANDQNLHDFILRLVRLLDGPCAMN